MKPKMRESDILRQVRDYLRIKGWYVIRIQQGLGCHKGISDLIIIKGGRVIFLEIKAENGHLNAYQQQFKQDVEDHGAYYLWVSSVDEIMQILGDI